MESSSEIFILKPDGKCQGKGIYLITRFEDIIVKEEGYVAQTYIHQPFLIDQLKWDLRLYVLLAGTNPLRLFVYNEGMARFATVKY